MPILTTAYVAVAVACFTVALERLLVAVRVRDRSVHVLIAATAVAAGIDALVQQRFALAESVAEIETLGNWPAISIATFLAMLACSVSHRTRAMRRPFLVVVLLLLAAAGSLDFFLPAGTAAFMEVTAIREVVLPWGEMFYLAAGTPSPWRVIGDLAILAVLGLFLDTTLRLYRRDERRQARLLGSSLTVFALSVLAIIPTDLGWIALPPLHPFAFLAIVGLMSWDLSDSVVREARLSREIVVNERRWRRLVDNAQLLVLRIDPEGRVVEVNPFCEAVLRRPASELRGLSATELVVAAERDEVGAALAEPSLATVPPASRWQMQVAGGARRLVEWRSVALDDDGGSFQGVLALGVDVTERDADRAELERTVRELERLRERLEEENLVLRSDLGVHGSAEGIVGESDGLLYVLHKIDQVAGSEASVLVQGETGTGKELVARTIHRRSPRAERPFVTVNCSALTPSLVESELFGHERGAFTGAERSRKGRFELADGGTLFLDEIGELPPDIQPKLLRVLELGELERVGGNRTVGVDVRVIAATNRDLREEVAAGRFREDLYYRLEVYPITVPPLRERRADVAPLVVHFLERLNRGRRQPVDEVPPEVIRRLEAYHWPGNVRELHNIVERAVLASPANVLRLAEPLEVDPQAEAAAAEAENGRVATLEEVERRHIRWVIDLCAGQIAGAGGAAEKLGLHANTLRSRMKKLGIERSPRQANQRGERIAS